MDNNKTYTVTNRSAGMVVYTIPDEGIRREFQPGESRKISFGELEKLSYQQGGRELMASFLQIMEDEVTDSLGIPRENEYYMNEAQIIDLLRHGSMAAFEDALDFAPIGVIDLIKKFAVELPLTDLNKINILRNKTGYDVEKILRNVAEDEPEEEKITPAAAAKQTTGRRTNTNYKVVSKG